ncbi:hypothetical protein BDV98DRAFT_583774 [Pterulicium gracile]|uniref:C2H2-type domain-containing protein n=1 Tax=Pterulicium gracile TaxID=1884261 RepID=A0A5C3QEP4_9AGAR|nr:hypothetical protein BDV98DRAFT_583774 [Pterula gracilis]
MPPTRTPKQKRTPNAMASSSERFDCTICEKSPLKKNKARHNRTHAAQTHRCGDCGKDLSRKDALVRHELRACKGPCQTHSTAPTFSTAPKPNITDSTSTTSSSSSPPLIPFSPMPSSSSVSEEVYPASTCDNSLQHVHHLGSPDQIRISYNSYQDAGMSRWLESPADANQIQGFNPVSGHLGTEQVGVGHTTPVQSPDRFAEWPKAFDTQPTSTAPSHFVGAPPLVPGTASILGNYCQTSTNSPLFDLSSHLGSVQDYCTPPHCHSLAYEEYSQSQMTSNDSDDSLRLVNTPNGIRPMQSDAERSWPHLNVGADAPFSLGPFPLIPPHKMYDIAPADENPVQAFAPTLPLISQMSPEDSIDPLHIDISNILYLGNPIQSDEDRFWPDLYIGADVSSSFNSSLRTMPFDALYDSAPADENFMQGPAPTLPLISMINFHRPYYSPPLSLTESPADPLSWTAGNEEAVYSPLTPWTVDLLPMGDPLDLPEDVCGPELRN